MGNFNPIIKSLIEMIVSGFCSLIQEVIREEIDLAFQKHFQQQKEEELLTKQEICDKLKISDTTFWRRKNDFDIPNHGSGKFSLYKLSEVIEVLDQTECSLKGKLLDNISRNKN
ncbi:MAG: hypothetical protein NT007_00910 [Candidatus Kapabacteria bacterium]|nr:hypothetical protein [Candidatus Kapabacteria bacterium]